MLQLIATGNLTRDPELRQTNSGKSVCNFTIAANHEFKGADGNRPTYVDVVVWEKRAIALASLLKKGTRVFVKGELEGYAYTDKSEVKHEKHRMILDDLEILSPRTNENGGKE
jgi:single-strand DNA-binding protein